MKIRWFSHALLGLALAGLILTGAAGAEESQTPSPPLGPSDWARVDGQDHDLDEMLSLLRPPDAETLAIFAPSQKWKPFYDKIYGRDPIDLALYAVIYHLSLGGPDSPALEDWPSFYQKTPADSEAAGPDRPTPAFPRGELVDPPSSESLTFRTTLVPGGEYGSQEEDTIYTVFTSLILTGRQVFFLNLFQLGPDDLAEIEHLALGWRAEFLEAQTPVLEESRNEQTLE